MQELKILLNKLTETFEGQLKGQTPDEFLKSQNFKRYRKSFMLMPEHMATSLPKEVQPDVKYISYSKSSVAPEKLPEIMDHDIDSTMAHRRAYETTGQYFDIPEPIKSRPKTFEKDGRTYQRMIMVPAESLSEYDISEKGDFIPVKANLKMVSRLGLKVPHFISKDQEKHFDMRRQYKEAMAAKQAEMGIKKRVINRNKVSEPVTEPIAPEEYNDRYPRIKRLDPEKGADHSLVALIHAPKGEEPDGDKHPISIFKKHNNGGHISFFSTRYPSGHSIIGRNVPTKKGLETELELYWPDNKTRIVVNKNTPNAQEIIQKHAWEAHPGRSNNYALNDQNFNSFNTDPYSWDLPISHPLAAFGEKI